MSKLKPSGSCAKFIVAGEYSALQDSECVVFPITSKRLTIHPRNPSLEDNDSGLSKQDLETTKNLLEVLGIPPTEASNIASSIIVESNIPRALGLGSSAAFCVELARKTLQTKDPEETFEFAWKAEEVLHGKSSGADPACVSHECPISYKKSLGVRPLTAHSNFENYRWILRRAEGERSVGAKSSISGMMSQKDRQFLISEIAACSGKASQALQTGKQYELFQALSNCGALLGKLGLETDATLSAQNELNELGCEATKITGAGNGGYVLGCIREEKLGERKLLLKEEDLIVSFSGRDETQTWL